MQSIRCFRTTKMNEDPALYSKHCRRQKLDANHFLDTYFRLLDVKNDATILDVGSGDGTVTLEALLPRLPNFSKLVVSDVSEKMIQFARGRFNDARIQTVRMNISDNNDSFTGYFDHIFSFYCLDMVPEERTPQAIRNIFEMLKPGGNFFGTLIVDATLYEFCDSMIQDNKWPRAMADFLKVISHYRDSDNPEEKFRFFLENAGFDVQVCKHEKRNFTYVGFKNFLDYALSIFPVPKISQEERAKFVEDFEDTVRKRNFDDIDNVQFFYSVLVVCASKPGK